MTSSLLFWLFILLYITFPVLVMFYLEHESCKNEDEILDE